MSLYKRCVVFLSYALEHHTQKVFIGFQDALCHREALYAGYALDVVDGFRQTVVNTDGMLRTTIIGHHIAHLDMTAETYHLIADGMFEAQHHADSDNHHCQTNGNADGGNTNSRTTHFPFVALISIDFLCYEKRQIHSSTLPG